MSNEYNSDTLASIKPGSRAAGVLVGGILGALTGFVSTNPINMIGSHVKQIALRSKSKSRLALNFLKLLYFFPVIIATWLLSPLYGFINGIRNGYGVGFKRSFLVPALSNYDITKGWFNRSYDYANLDSIDDKRKSQRKELISNDKLKILNNPLAKIESAIYIGIAALAITATLLVIFPPAGVIATTITLAKLIFAFTLNSIAPTLLPAVPYLLAAMAAGVVAIAGKLLSSIGFGIGNAIKFIKRKDSKNKEIIVSENSLSAQKAQETIIPANNDSTTVNCHNSQVANSFNNSKPLFLPSNTGTPYVTESGEAIIATVTNEKTQPSNENAMDVVSNPADANIVKPGPASSSNL